MTKSMVEGIIIKLDNGNDLVLKVALDNRVPQRLKSLFKFNDFYEDYIEATLENCVDNFSVIKGDFLLDQILQTIDEKNWDKQKFDLDTIEDCDYLINNILAILCGNLFGENNGNGMFMIIPTTYYEYFKDKIFFEIRGLDGSISPMNIVDFMNLISTFNSEPCTDPDDDYNAKYMFENRYTYFVITKYDTYTVIESYVTTKWE